MPAFRCPTCNGEYADPQRSGEYVHECPPLSEPEGVLAGALPAKVLTGVPLTTAEQRDLRGFLEASPLRDGHRDENAMVTCPACGGSGGLPNPAFDPDKHSEPESGVPPTVVCGTCRGARGLRDRRGRVEVP